MKIDLKYSTAVFLGPSLPLNAAKSVLSANYFPPIKFGDIYKLMASNIDTFIIIDGMFDGVTPVWHREILCALQLGKQVLGATSMGALRGMELTPYGMHGRGQIYQWYCDGVIDGDDEVALFHGNEELAYQKFSEPLVNIRHNLTRAVDAKIITQGTSNKIIEHLKLQYFGKRSFDFIYQFMDEQQLSAVPLRTFISAHYEDLKAKDTLDILSDFSGCKIPKVKSHKGWHQRQAPTHHLLSSVEVLNGAVIKEDGELVAHADILQKVQESWNQYSHLMIDVVEQHYLLQWIPKLDKSIPIDEQEIILTTWCGENSVEISDIWLMANGYQHKEWISDVTLQHQIAVAIEQLAAEYHIEISIISKCLTLEHVIPDVLQTDNEKQLKQKSVIICLLAHFAFDCGYRVPVERVRLFEQRWPVLIESPEHRQWLDKKRLTAKEFNKGIERILMYIWLIEVQPHYLGLLWEPEVDLFRMLRRKGYLKELAS